MSRLDDVIFYTPQLDRMREFYQRAIGLPPREEIADWVQFDSPGVHLALHAQWEGHEREAALVFGVPDFDGMVESLGERGLAVERRDDEKLFGRVAIFRDPDGNLVEIHPAGAPAVLGSGPLPRVLLNVGDLKAALAFYGELLALPVADQQDHWAELDARSARLALHQRVDREDAPLHAGQRIVFGFETADLANWAEALRARGLSFATAPTDEGFGAYAEAVDPDGNIVLFHEPLPPPSSAEELAEPFDDMSVAGQVSMRKPVRKSTKSVLAAPRPARKASGTPKRKRPSATTMAVSKVRGGGPERTRLTPKRTGDEKKARGKTAIGRARKATRNVMEKKKTAVATSSKSRPVKRAARPAKKK